MLQLVLCILVELAGCTTAISLVTLQGASSTAHQTSATSNDTSELQLRSTFFEFVKRASESGQHDDDGVWAKKFLAQHDEFLRNSEMEDPTPFCTLNYFAIAAACYLQDFDAAFEIARQNLSWCDKHVEAPNSYHSQTARGYQYHLQQLKHLPEDQQTAFAKALARKWFNLLSLQNGYAIEQAEIKNAIDSLQQTGTEFSDILGPGNWFSFETSYYCHRNSPVSEEWRQGIEALLSQVPEIKFILENHLIVSKIRVSLANYNFRRGKFDAARKYLNAITEVDEQLGTPNANRGTVQAALGEIEHLLGRTKDAYLICRKAVDQFDDTPITDLTVRQCEIRAETIGKLGLYEAQLGNIQNAATNLETASGMWEKVIRYSPSRLTSLRLSETLLRLARLRVQLKQKSQAATDASRALTNLARHFPKNSLFFRHHALTAATIFANTGELDLAREFVVNAVKQLDSKSETQSPQSLIHFLQQAVFVLQKSGDHELAAGLIEDITDSVKKSRLPRTAKQQFLQVIDRNAAFIALRSGNRNASFDLTEGLIRKQLPLLPKRLLHYDESETLVAAAQLHSETLMLLAATNSEEPQQVRRALETVLQTKAIASQLLSMRDRTISEFDATLGHQYKKLRAGMSTLAMQARFDNSDNSERQLVELEDQKKLFFANLPEPVEQGVLGRPLPSSSLDELAKRLTNEFAFVEIVKNSRLRKDNSHQYQAFVLHRNEEGKVTVQLVLLGNAEMIDKWVFAWRSQFVVADARDVKRKTKPSTLNAESAGASLYKTVWSRIAAIIGNKTKLVVAGDGALSLLPWATIPNGKSFSTGDQKEIPGRLIDDYQFVDAISLRMLTQDTKSPNAQNLPATMFVDVDYGGPRDSDSPDTRLDMPRWTKLGKSEQEQSAFERCFGKSNCQIFRQLEASKDNFEQVADQSRILHLSTHGYYLAVNPNRISTSYVDQLRQSNNIFRRNPWVSCGVVFANANQPPTDSNNSSAIFSGEEIVCRSFENVDLAVLSTCKSGEGEVFDGEGAFGMQHAFVLAGAKCAVGTYWAVSDSKTNLFMEQFYKHLGSGMCVGDALHKAQKFFRKAGYDARHWGAWIVSGNWEVTR